MHYLLLLHRILPDADITRTTYPLEKLTSFIKNPPLPIASFAKSSISLSFDDATFDFYLYVYPLLKKYNLKALLAIPTAFILESSTLSVQKRMASIPFQDKQAHLTWKEIKEMTQSGHVIPISHSHTHKPLTQITKVEQELALSKSLLEEKLDRSIDTIAFPYGKCDAKVLKMAKRHYLYFLRIGNASNLSWHNLSGLTYRIPMESLRKDLPKKRLFINWLKNSIRGK